jgi:hypothetical protein
MKSQSTDWNKLWKIYWNGIEFMYGLAPRVAQMGADSPHSNSNGDMAFHKLVTSKIYAKYKGKVHPLVEQFLLLQDTQEKHHGEMYNGDEKRQEEFSRRALELNLKYEEKYGLAAYFAVQNIIGERIPLLHGALKHYPDDAHETPTGFVDEYFHTSAPILLIPLITDDLDLVLKAQKEYLEEVKTIFSPPKPK